MTPETALKICHYTLVVAAKMSAPYLLAAILVGVLTNVLQTVTQLKDQSITFIPKVVAIGIIGLFAMPWEVNLVLGYFNYIIELFGTV